MGSEMCIRDSALLVYDRATRFRACYPLPDKTAESAVVAFKHILHGFFTQTLPRSWPPRRVPSASLMLRPLRDDLRPTASLRGRYAMCARALVAFCMQLVFPNGSGISQRSTFVTPAMFFLALQNRRPGRRGMRIVERTIVSFRMLGACQTQ